MPETEGKIYTKRGDSGETRLLSGETVAKDSPRLKVYGCLDELQSHLGMARSLVARKPIQTILKSVQQDIFVAASELASTAQTLADLKHRIGPAEISRLESQIDELTALHGLPGHFVIPGNSVESSALHVARSVCRRSERLIIGLHRQVPDYPQLLVYFNRLSDLLFVLAWSCEVHATVENTVRDLLRDEPQIQTNSAEDYGLTRAKHGRVFDKDSPIRIVYPLAQQLVAIARIQAEALGVPMVIAVTDAAGTLLCFGRMDGALPASNELAVSKAFTAAVLRMDTQELGRLAQPGAPLYGIQQTHQGRIVLLGGGLPLRLQDRVVGAVGVSGGSVEEDIEVARSAVEALEEMAEWAKVIGEAVRSDQAQAMRSLRKLEEGLRDQLVGMGVELSDRMIGILTGAVLLALEGHG